MLNVMLPDRDHEHGPAHREGSSTPRRRRLARLPGAVEASTLGGATHSKRRGPSGQPLGVRRASHRVSSRPSP